ncbi:MAG: IS1096 element passenger TnpR family protein, partial [Bacteroidia bacterium]
MSKILQFKISLKRSNPKIWRRFQIENNLMFF